MAKKRQPRRPASSRIPNRANRPANRDQNVGEETSSQASDESPFEVFAGSAKEAIAALNKAPLGKLVEILNAAGVRPHPAFTQAAEERLQMLEPFQTRPDYQRLEQEGVQKETMMIALTVINIAPEFDRMFRTSLYKRSRQRFVKQLLAPIPVLKKLDGVMGDTIKKFPGTTIGRADLLVSNLQHFANIMSWADDLKELLGSNSFLGLAKYAFAGLVKRVTNKYHDREVSALTGAALLKSDYDETTHRVWRIQNYPRLEATCPIAPNALQSLNSVFSKK
jgi:hypothetical protein